MKKAKIIGAVAIVVVLGGLVWFFTKGPSGQQVSMADATDTAVNYYNEWLAAAQKPADANPSMATLAQSPILSESLRTRLESAEKDPSAQTVDPVLCQTTVPTGITTRNVSEENGKAQILITSKDKKVTNQALVMLNALNGGWYIDDIQCSAGEFAPKQEYSFEQLGYLLKASIPKPYNPKDWHLIFEQDGELGHVVPLFFDSSSQCTALDGTVSVCKPADFTETTKVYVQAQMTELGAQVKKMQFIKE